MNKKYLQKLVEKILASSISSGKINEKKLDQAVKLLCKLPRIQAILALELFLKRVKIFLQKSTLQVESSENLTKKQKELLTKKFVSHLPSHTSCFTLNPQLLGGVRIKIGDTLIDGSIKGKILKVKEAICQT